MGGLPNGHNAVIPEGKVRNYLLNHQHDEGGPKAAFLAEFDYGPDEWREFTKAIQLHAIEADAMQIAETGYGVKFRTVGRLRTPDGRNPIVTFIWQYDTGSDQPKLITLIPRGNE